ncbi:TRAP transporter small permease [Thauera sp.]|jgi:TRAP-type C4-dicarboxylate transport system permease small subunit|uniref:TRAP transporter small permease n=1 Tax=Thauera sp. TaxID=1905334 RepID=UPI00260214E9|nr:TRAP transporter small permease [Thauera sp.]MCK6407822.1 TRAP transporter small permease [Thauera sp.]
MDALLSRLRKGVESLLIVTLTGMVLLTFIDVIGRRLFGTPVYGAHDATEHLMAIMVFCGLPLLTAARGHLTVDLFDKVLLRPGMGWWHRLISALMTAVLLLIAYEFLNAAIEAGEIREVSQSLSIPRGGIYAFIAFTSLLSALAALIGCFVPVNPHATPHQENPT